MPKKPKPHELRERETRVRLGFERTERPRSMLPERHLFVTEGTKTEPNYLYGLINKIAERYGDAAKKQFNVQGEGSNTLYLLQRAERYQQSDAEGYQHIWLLYD